LIDLLPSRLDGHGRPEGQLATDAGRDSKRRRRRATRTVRGTRKEAARAR